MISSAQRGCVVCLAEHAKHFSAVVQANAGEVRNPRFAHSCFSWPWEGGDASGSSEVCSDLPEGLGDGASGSGFSGGRSFSSPGWG